MEMGQTALERIVVVGGTYPDEASMLVPPHHARAKWPTDDDAADMKRVGGAGSTTDHLQADDVAMVLNRSSTAGAPIGCATIIGTG